MKLSKRIIKSNFVMNLAASLIASYIRFVGATTKWHMINYDVYEHWCERGMILAFWHGRLLMIPYHAKKGVKANILISSHSDGEIIARVQEKLGFNTIRGSLAREGKKGKGGTAAIREMIRARQRHELIAITPDGPRGPARKVGGKAVEIAKLLELPIIPVTFSCSKARIAKSWDSFMIAKPFGKGVFAFGEAIPPELAHELEDRMNKLTEEADAAVKNL